MKIPPEFAGNEEMYKLAVRHYITDLAGRAIDTSQGLLSGRITSLMGRDLMELGQEMMMTL